MTKKIFIYLLLIITYNSCETTLDIDLPNTEPKIVINSYMISEEYWDARTQFLTVSHSIGGLGSIQDYTYTDDIPVINTATAMIKEISLDNSIITEYPLIFHDNCYCYSNPELTPKENTIYELNVSAEGYPNISATEIMPFKPNYTISNFIMFNELDDTLSQELCEFHITIDDVENQNNYYKLKIYTVNTFQNKKRSCEYKTQDPIFLIPINRYNSENNYYEGQHGYFTDELFEGSSRSIFIQAKKPEGDFDHFYIEVTSYSENLYQFNSTRKEQVKDANNILFNSEAIFMHSNINQGYGIFGGRAVTRKAYIPTYFPTNGWMDY